MPSDQDSVPAAKSLDLANDSAPAEGQETDQVANRSGLIGVKLTINAQLVDWRADLLRLG